MFTGIVESVGDVLAVERSPDFRRLTISSPQVAPESAVGGSVAVDGVCLTIARVMNDGFAVSLIPHTLAATTIASKRAGDEVNIEVDIVAKYIARLAAAHVDSRRGGADARTV